MKIFFLFILGFCPAILIAQGPVLTVQNTAPMPGDGFGSYLADTVGVPNAEPGENKIWNYSSLQVTNTRMPFEWVSPSSTPDGSLFPPATACEITSAAGIPVLYSYSRITNNNWSVIGLTNSIIKYAYLDPEQVFQFPFSYQSSFNDTFLGAGIIGIFPSFRTGYRSAVAEGWGKLILPDREIENTLLVKVVQHYKDSSDLAVSVIHLEGQFWYDGIHKAPLLQIYQNTTTIDTGSVTGKYVLVSQEALGVQNQYEAKFSIFPNPASDFINVSFPDNKDRNIDIINMQGKTVKKIVFSGNEISVDIRDLPPGMYVVRCNTSFRKFIVDRY